MIRTIIPTLIGLIVLAAQPPTPNAASVEACLEKPTAKCTLWLAEIELQKVHPNLHFDNVKLGIGEAYAYLGRDDAALAIACRPSVPLASTVTTSTGPS